MTTHCGPACPFAGCPTCPFPGTPSDPVPTPSTTPSNLDALRPRPRPRSSRRDGVALDHPVHPDPVHPHMDGVTDTTTEGP